ncbi:hypothetical protein [Streptomyces yangpuensis]|uniref:hypothetical protein n=1 Tax=Streptomyces yangpuensis TaxID=1648182 RepID=UPI0006298D21|nr:hypothetical protein [Streptomyces yangpuensis]
MKWTNEINLGDTLASAFALIALGLAVWQLVSSRKDLIAERRADFYLGELMTLSVALGSNPGTALQTPEIAIRLKVLPPDLVPLLRQLANSPAETVARIRQEQEEDPRFGNIAASGYLRRRCQEDIAGAVGKILETVPRRHWWQRQGTGGAR